jgi:hypothetical protein
LCIYAFFSTHKYDRAFNFFEIKKKEGKLTKEVVYLNVNKDPSGNVSFSDEDK